MRSVEYPPVGEIAEASYPIIVFAGVLVEQIEGRLRVQLVCVWLKDTTKTRRGDKLAIAIGTQAKKKERKEKKKVQLGCEQDFLFGSLRNRFPIRVFVPLGRATLYIIFQCLKQLHKIRPPRKQISVAGSFTVKKEKVAQFIMDFNWTHEIKKKINRHTIVLFHPPVLIKEFQQFVCGEEQMVELILRSATRWLTQKSLQSQGRARIWYTV